jgi:pimeloyl-ACP methyl ester carboxylesterase
MGAAAARDGKIIAQRGYAVLQLAYFDSSGLLKDLGLIPLEYFKSAIDWLRAQPAVNPGRIGIVGGSIGSEVALTVAAHYPEIRVVVATMPSSVVWPGIVHTEGAPPSTFTLARKPLPFLPYGYPFTSIFNLYAKGLLTLDDHRDAIIPVERRALGSVAKGLRPSRCSTDPYGANPRTPAARRRVGSLCATHPRAPRVDIARTSACRTHVELPYRPFLASTKLPRSI